MGRLVVLIYLLFNSGFLFASCSEVPTKIKDDYATKMHFAFLLQSQGKSTLAQFNFETACMVTQALQLCTHGKTLLLSRP